MVKELSIVWLLTDMVSFVFGRILVLHLKNISFGDAFVILNIQQKQEHKIDDLLNLERGGRIGQSIFVVIVLILVNSIGYLLGFDYASDILNIRI